MCNRSDGNSDQDEIRGWRSRYLSGTLVGEMKSNTWSREMSGSNRRGGGPREEGCEKNGGGGGGERGGRKGSSVRRWGRKRTKENSRAGRPWVGIAIKAICCIVPAIRRRQLSPTVLTSSQGLSVAWSTCALSISLSSYPVERRPRRPPCPVRNLAYIWLECVNPDANLSAIAVSSCD